MVQGIIDKHAVEAAGGQVLPDGSGVSVGGWHIFTHRGPIAADPDAESFKDSLGVMSIPEQWYDSNLVKITHEATGTSLSFTARDALQQWHNLSEGATGAPPPVHVPAAAEWMKARQGEMEAHAAKRIEYEWTFTTPYAGSVVVPQGEAPQWEPTGEHMDRGLLTSRDPILYFDDVPLYESELEDNGISQLSVKVRVMPKCWYVLLRFFLRVDGVLVRLREARLFSRFDAPVQAVVLREVRHHEGTFEELHAGGAPPDGPAYVDGDAAATALQAAAPVGVTHYRMERLQLGAAPTQAP